MEKIQLTRPLYKLDYNLLKKDIPVASEEKLSRLFIRRRIPLFMDGYRYAADAVKKRWDINFYFFESGHEPVKSVYLSEALNEKAAVIWLRNMDKDKGFAKALVNEVKDIVVMEKKLAKSIPQRALSKKEIEKYLLKHLEWWIEFFEVAFLWFCVENIKEKIDIEVKNQWKRNPGGLRSFLKGVYRPMKLPQSSVEQRDLLKLSPLAQKKLELALQKHWKKYKHLSLHNPDDEYFDINYYAGRVKILQNPIEYKKQKVLLESADYEMTEANILLKEAKLPKTLKERIEFIRWFMYLRTETVDHMMLVNSAFKSVLNSLVRHLGLPADAVLHMTYEEIMSSLKQGNLSIGKDIIMERLNNGYAFLIAPNGSYLVMGNEVDILQNLVIPKQTSKKISEFKGQAAFSGNVRGVARVILDRRQSKELKEGEILVTTMTSPEFVPAMKLSAGIITNEGGILCHAAIMSRELRKPCIIGTKIATDIIKTGDMVEVDADNGIVKIIK